MNIEQKIQEKTAEAIQQLYAQEIKPEDITLSATRKEFEGNYTVVVFPFTRFAKKPPEDTGKEIGEYLKKEVEEIADFNVIKGFLNLIIADEYWLEFLQNASQNKAFGKSSPSGKKVMVEYCAPNTNKPLHLGHIRNMVVGYSISEILKANGHEVIKANLINDRGIHICKSMLAWQRWGGLPTGQAGGETPESSGIKGDHLVGKYYVLFDKEYKKQIEALKQEGKEEEIAKKEAPLIIEAQEMLKKWEAGDEAIHSLWAKMNGWVYKGFEETYKKLGVDFDKVYYESETYLLGKKIVEEGLEQGVFYKKENGSVWVNLEKEGLDEKLLLRSDGTSVYITQDMGTAQLKYDDYKIDQSIYVVGNEQDYHFQVLQAIMKKLGKPYAGGIYHLSYGMVELPTGKMKSREGTVVDADDLINEMTAAAKEKTQELGKIEGLTAEQAVALYRTIGLGALKYFLLKVEPKKNMLFNPEESIELQGHTGPFIQYTYARIQSILRKEKDIKKSFLNLQLQKEEKEVLQLIHEYPNTVKEAATVYDPSVVAHYVFNLAKTYNKFYTEVPILGAKEEAVKNFRLLLSEMTANIIQSGMKVLGIDVPERM